MISVDPSSPFTQGALLGDRIRLADHFLDPGVFIRSMGTRGHLGGLAEATLQALLLLDAAGKDLVFLETVGTGQSEVEVIGDRRHRRPRADARLGDSIQALKAGIMEIPDVIAINKMDPAAKTMLSEVRSILSLGHEREWKPPIVLTEAMRGEKVDEALGEDRPGTARISRRRRAGGAPPRATSPRGVRGRLDAREAHLELAVPRTRSCGACSTRCRSASSTRSPRCARSWRRSSTSAKRTRARRSLTSRRPASASTGSRASRPSTAPRRSRARARTVWLKAENLQRTGSFKIRGAVNKLSTLDEEERAAGVVAASAGNHGQAVAWAARELGTRRRIFMPQDSPMAKVDATRDYGAEVVLDGAGFEDTSRARRVRRARRARRSSTPFEDE